MGEVYCGTDTPRDATSAWWQRPVAHRNEEQGRGDGDRQHIHPRRVRQPVACRGHAVEDTGTGGAAAWKSGRCLAPSAP
ncbi:MULTISPECIES: hypothetical protein [Streptomyces]|uniref:hypothetical protein n=1 Tax=Streptomyces TaxID=1883 RepID=UPI001F0EE774|nr:MULTISPECIES: hypothetical protein [Streptomyces]